MAYGLASARRSRRPCRARPTLTLRGQRTERIRADDAEYTTHGYAAADEGAGGAPSHGVSLACVGCGRQPWQLGKKKFQVCPWCADAKLPATFWCGTDCPANPEAWRKHKEWHKELKEMREKWEDGGVKVGGRRCEAAAAP